MSFNATSLLALASVVLPFQTRERPPDIPITSARFGIERRAVDTIVLQLQNLRDSPMVLWSTRVGSHRNTWTHGQPILPRETRAFNIATSTPGENATTASVTFAVFEDGWVEGAPETIEEWKAARRQQAAESVGHRRSQYAFARVVSIRLASLAHDMQSRRIDMIRPQFHAALPAGNPVPSVAIRGLIEPVTKVFVTIENLRDVAIESYAYELFDSPVQSLPSSRATRSLERIAPHATRTIEVSDRSVTPTAKLSFVLFDDLVFEGSVEPRDELFRRRETQAAEYTYWIAVLAEARSKPAADVRSFLTLKQRERIQATGDDAKVVAGIALQLADTADREPQNFITHLDSMRESMQKMEQMLTRHLRR